MRKPSSNKLALGNYAAVPGSGPKDDACRFTCDQYKTIAKRQGRAISPQTPACRYFSLKPPRDPAEGRA